MEASGSTCSHCRTQGVGVKRCSRCKSASYCSADCQKAAWKGHKNMCKKDEDVWHLLHAAQNANDWRQILKWEGRMGDLMENQTDDICHRVLALFETGYYFAFAEMSSGRNAGVARPTPGKDGAIPGPRQSDVPNGAIFGAVLLQ